MEDTAFRLVKPHLRFQTQYLEMLHTWEASEEQPAPWIFEQDYSDFAALVCKLNDLSRGVNVPTEFVPCTTYWAYLPGRDRLVGGVNIRHYLNDFLAQGWGHIGYGVHPDERHKGYATLILKMTLQKCRTMGLQEVLLGCFKENIASARTILNNGGVLENEIIDNESGKLLQRYWIKLA
ncbi:MAG: GNAT family N-acetyltransferase [Chloroflexi bacterium]|nr:GNAT family N-acetyltransferase [Chloroflexota bacterium]